MSLRLARAELVSRHPLVPAADPRDDALFTARAALKRALAISHDAALQVDQLRSLVDRLEAQRHT